MSRSGSKQCRGQEANKTQKHERRNEGLNFHQALIACRVIVSQVLTSTMRRGHSPGGSFGVLFRASAKSIAISLYSDLDIECFGWKMMDEVTLGLP